VGLSVLGGSARGWLSLVLYFWWCFNIGVGGVGCGGELDKRSLSVAAKRGG